MAGTSGAYGAFLIPNSNGRAEPRLTRSAPTKKFSPCLSETGEPSTTCSKALGAATRKTKLRRQRTP
jgi:hypothetical protein